MFYSVYSFLTNNCLCANKFQVVLKIGLVGVTSEAPPPLGTNDKKLARYQTAKSLRKEGTCVNQEETNNDGVDAMNPEINSKDGVMRDGRRRSEPMEEPPGRGEGGSRMFRGLMLCMKIFYSF